MSDLQKKVDKYLRAAMIGTVAVVVAPPTYLGLVYLPLDLDPIPTLLLSVPLLLLALFTIIASTYAFIHLFIRRKTDEFTLAMWHAGTTFAFFAVIGWLLIGGLVEAVWEASIMANDPELKDPEFNVIADWASWVVCAAFFVGFHIKRVKG